MPNRGTVIVHGVGEPVANLRVCNGNRRAMNPTCPRPRKVDWNAGRRVNKMRPTFEWSTRRSSNNGTSCNQLSKHEMKIRRGSDRERKKIFTEANLSISGKWRSGFHLHVGAHVVQDGCPLLQIGHVAQEKIWKMSKCLIFVYILLHNMIMRETNGSIPTITRHWITENDFTISFHLLLWFLFVTFFWDPLGAIFKHHLIKNLFLEMRIFFNNKRPMAEVCFCRRITWICATIMFIYRLPSFKPT